ncbi:MAG: T9SS type A sorting domain-containing protein, partial [Fibrobacteres bacterium]|nr:T9SS type A sorting domain-containing protein [Fibrobacterota bacterium]
KHYWDYGSKREYQSTKFNTSPTTISKYAFHDAPKNDGLVNTNTLFYESTRHGDTIAPSAITDLSGKRVDGTNKILLSWTAPIDNNGKCTEYQIKFQKNQKIVEYFDYDYARDESTAVPFWFAENESGEPIPQIAGASETFSPIREFPKNELWYAVICSRDSSNNLSPVSNLLRIDSNITSAENINSAIVSAGFDAYPNPFNPSIKIRVSLPSGLKELPKLTIHDISGRLIKSLTFNQKPGTHFIEWNGRNNSGTKIASGMFVIKLTANGKCWTKKILMSK